MTYIYMSDLHSINQVSKMSTEEIKNVLSEYTPLYSDINNLIAGYAEPIKFKVGDIIITHSGKPDYLIIKRNKKSLRVLQTNWIIRKGLDDLIDVSYYTEDNVEYIVFTYHRIDKEGQLKEESLHLIKDDCLSYIDNESENVFIMEIEQKYTGNRIFKTDKLGNEYIPAGYNIKDRIYPYHTFDTEDKEISFIEYPKLWKDAV